MKIELHFPDTLVSAIAEQVAGRLQPLLVGGKAEEGEGVALMAAAELAAYLGVSKDWIYQRTSKNEIPFVKVGAAMRFRRSEIDLWLLRQGVPAVTPLSVPLPGKRTRDSVSLDGVKTTL